ncbi:MAG: GAF domain-containing sensor histidine kinase [Patescibacteria group bacterium]
MSNKLRATLELKTIYESIFKTLEPAFHQKKFAIMLFDEQSGYYNPVYTNNISLNSDTVAGNKVCKFVIKYDKPFSLEDEHAHIPAGFQSLRKLGVEIVNPLNIKGKCVGLMLFGAKESGDRYNEEDFSVLDITGTQAAIAIDNARLYEEVKHFNEDLQKKVALATKKLQQQNGKLKELDQMKSEFISVASHQLRTPLTATKWALEFLLKGEDGKINAKQKESLTEMSIMNTRLITLVNELLNISRIDEGRLKIEPKPINVAEAVKSSLAEMLPIARKKNLSVVQHYDKIPSIKLDPNIISKAISNILSNAVKYNRDGKHLWVSVRKNKEHVLIVIQDEGIGIPVKEQGQLFQRFYRASNATSSSTEGSGLGLYIAKSVLEMSGGTIVFESKEGVGTTFTITLPLKGSKARAGEKSLA